MDAPARRVHQSRVHSLDAYDFDRPQLESLERSRDLLSISDHDHLDLCWANVGSGPPPRRQR